MDSAPAMRKTGGYFVIGNAENLSSNTETGMMPARSPYPISNLRQNVALRFIPP